MTDRTPRPCPYCNFVYYSKSTYSAHVNAEHWKELEAEKDEQNDETPRAANEQNPPKSVAQ